MISHKHIILSLKSRFKSKSFLLLKVKYILTIYFKRSYINMRIIKNKILNLKLILRYKK